MVRLKFVSRLNYLIKMSFLVRNKKTTQQSGFKFQNIFLTSITQESDLAGRR